MRYPSAIAVIFLVLFSFLKSFAQGEVPVDMYTGRALVSIPLGSITDHDISDDVALDYNASGVKVVQDNGYYGLGWSMRCGGLVSREVRGLPDDFNSGSSDRRGWFYAGVGSGVQNNYDVSGASGTNYTTADTLMSTYTDEGADFAKIYDSDHYFNDTEPDLFSYAFGPYSGQFVFDNTNTTTPAVRFIPYADLTVTVTRDAGNRLSAFVFKDNLGNTYTCDVSNLDSRSTYNIASSIDYFTRDYANYQSTAGITGFATQWMLSSAASEVGGRINYTYTAESLSSSDTVRVYTHNSSGSGFTAQNIFRNVRTQWNYRIATASSTSTTVTFSYTSRMLSTVVFNDLRGSAPQMQFNFSANTVSYAGLPVEYARKYLKTITQVSGATSYPPYQFSYVNETTYTIPSRFSKNVDFWGYYNGESNSTLMPSVWYYPNLRASQQLQLDQITGYVGPNYSAVGANRHTAPAIAYGTLSRIIYPTGSFTNISYEPHSYWDPIFGSNSLAGGLRVKSISYSDGVNSSGTITKNFTYTDSLGRSSGKLISKPVFSIPFAHSGTTDWSKAFVITTFDLSPQETTHGSIVGYEEVTVSRPGSGYVRYQYLVPGTYGVYNKGNWIPTKNKFVRDANTAINPITSGGAWGFPYSPNPNFDHERGLQWQKREYNEKDTVVRWTRSYYQYVYRDTDIKTVYGVRYEYFPFSGHTPHTFFFGKYGLLTDTKKVLQSEKVIVFDAHDVTKKQTLVTAYVYSTTAHRLLTKLKKTSPDGTIYSSYYKYPLDYGAIPSGADVPSTMIGNLQSNSHNGVAIEQYSTIQKPGDTEKVYGASLTKYAGFSGLTLPTQSLSAKIQAPVALTSVFKPSFVDPSTKTFVNDATYQADNTISKYGAFGNPNQMNSANRVSSLLYWGYINSVPVLSVNNADYTQLGFSNFDNVFDINFTPVPNYIYYGTGRNSAQAASPGVTFTRTITKPSVNNYIVSFWINSSSSLSFTVNLKNTAGTSTYFTTSFVVPASGGSSFTYFSKRIPVTAAASTFVFSIVAPSIDPDGTSAPALLPVIDDLAFYPETADLTATSYSLPYGPSSIVKNGKVVSATYDNLGRKIFTKDIDNNILERLTYSNQLGSAFVASICASGAKTIQGNSNSTYTTTAEYTCGSVAMPPDPVMTTFSVIGNAPEGIASYVWKTRAIGASNWTDQVTTPTFTPARIANGLSTGGYQVCCLVTTQFGRSYTTAVAQVQIVPEP